MNRPYDVLVIGAGPAGLAAAIGARSQGANRVAVVERETYAGGVLPQCVHDGFGLHVFGRSLTGPEYAREWTERACVSGIELLLDTAVLSLQREKSLTSGAHPAADSEQYFAVEAIGSAIGGHRWLRAKSVVVATGCRERNRGELGIPGTRPTGVMTAGEAQYLMNVRNLLPGDKAVILGSGDIGLIMARRLTLEGAEVRLVLGAQGSGLLRNHLRCIKDFDIPLRNGWGIMSIHGHGRITGVTVAPLEADGSFDAQRKEYMRCNLLLLACGLIPEREVLNDLVSAERAGHADEQETTLPVGVFLCGNAERPHDLVDQVTQQGLAVGCRAASYVANLREKRAGSHRAENESEHAESKEHDISTSCNDPELRRLLALSIEEPKGRLTDLLSCEQRHAERIIACTVCPKGCLIEVEVMGEGCKTAEPMITKGAGCTRGEAFVRDEILHPLRLYTGTVKIAGIDHVLMPVRTASEIPRAKLFDVHKVCRRMKVHGSIMHGDVIVADIARTGVNLIACADYDRNATSVR